MKKIMAFMLLLTFLLPILPLQSLAKTITDGNSKWVTITTGSNRQYYLQTTTGTTLGGSAWAYTTDDGIKGGAWCVDWGKSNPPANKILPITGKYTANPQLIGAATNGYPQRPLEDFKAINVPDHPELSSLTLDEFAYASQVAVWATLGQVGVSGTAFSTGRSVVDYPTTAQQQRVYTALTIILMHAANWTKPMETGLTVRLAEDNPNTILDVQDPKGIAGAEENNMYGIRKETRGGVDYYTRTFSTSSMTSTFSYGYSIDISLENAPSGTFITALDGSALETTSNGWKVPNKEHFNVGNVNGIEYCGEFKVWLPVLATPESSEMKIKATTSISQYNVFFANNDDNNQQSYVVADPLYAPMTAEGTMRWAAKESLYGRLIVQKMDESGRPLAGAIFSLVGTDGSNYQGTTNSQGIIEWEMLNPDITWTLTETQAPTGFLLDPTPQQIGLAAGQTVTHIARNQTKCNVYIKKIDKQNGFTLLGGVFKIEQIDGSFTTTKTTMGDGYIHFESNELPLGSYKVTEITAPKGYEIDPTPQTFEWDGRADIELVFNNSRKPTLQIIKVDANTGATLEGAVFDAFKDGQFITSLTSDASGYMYLHEVTEGYYQFREKVAPSGYKLDSTSHEIYINPYDPATSDDPVLVIKNESQPSLRIIKYDKTTNTRLEGVTFEVYHDTVLIGQYTTNSNGEILLSGLAEGTYWVQEIATIHSHVINSTPQQIEIKAGQKEIPTLIFFNQLKPGIHLVKIDSETFAPLVNAKFLIKHIGGSYEKEYTTDINGEIDLTNLEPGAYQVIEIVAPNGYLIDDSVRTIQINPDENALFVFTNTMKPKLEIIKRDALTKEHLGGATFQISRIADGTRYLDRITDENGRILIDNLDEGVYSVQEVHAPENYLLNDTEYHVELFAGKTSTLVVENYRKPNITIKKIDSITGDAIKGAKFHVLYASNNTFTGELNDLGTFMTDEDGLIILENRQDGWWKVTEMEPAAGYQLKEPLTQEVFIRGGENKTLTFENTPLSAIIIKKVDARTGEPLANAKFRVDYLSGTSGTGGTTIIEVITTSQGTAVLTQLKAGTYIITETKAPDGYILDTTPKTVYISGNEQSVITVEFTNTKEGGFQIIKLDEESRQPIPDVEFEIRKMNGEYIGNFTTDAYGIITLSDWDAGWYTLIELRAKGYAVNSEPQNFEIKNDKIGSVTITNRKMSSVLIHKVDSVTGKGIYGVTFLISDENRNPLMRVTSDQDGYVFIDKKLSNGKFYVKEMEAPGYVLDPQEKTFYIEYGATSTIEWKNTAIQGQIQITKKSADDNPTNGLPKGTLLEGAVFEIRDYRTSKVVDTVKSDKSGLAISKPIPLGRYIIKEITAPPYYSVNPNTLDVTLEHSGQIIKVEVLNESVYTNVSVQKWGYGEVMPNQEMLYTFDKIRNNGTVPLDSFYWRDTLPVDAIRLTKIITGTWNQKLSYKIVYKTNQRDWTTLADNLSTGTNYVLPASQSALGLAGNEYVTEFMFVFGRVAAGFSNVEMPKVYGITLGALANGYQFTNHTDVGGLHGEQWIMGNARWVTKVYAQPSITKLPRTGY